MLGKRAEWVCDGWDSAAAEVTCALVVCHNRASSQMQLALTPRDRLPQVASLYAEGKVSYRVISAIAWHTELVTEGEPLALIDSALAKQATILWEPETATDAEVRAMERHFIRESRANNPAIGYNLTPRWTG